ncbi:hypothetical protein E1A91_A01G012600v1 [Gossypium mustelinum]|uniref:Knottin scorpion toxin-like domain-containing protein n=4 Tax=Gossypium TaxID=3633 RepID=A0A5J5WSD5_GOSBA|nr:hypothetical protein ES319_A01G011800v1 [Gossypium barbadense]TYH29476.1 hypothetical protein ES288_A01G014600v1 [Gossypium darwinii]TYI41349.1 hypothetical protein ES332_A01G014200v1 [Gossypium tomentosum]TYJ47761.1 hypothetical protein E1A91_A01G012600v1 [Gossypium mustelinum]
MGKISLTHVFILALLFTVISMVANVEAQKRCSEVLNPSGCLLAECRQECSEKYVSGVGECIGNGGTPLQPIYECVCVYDCPL